MERRTFGRSGPELPVIGLGAGQAFDVTDEAAIASCCRLVEAALAAGTQLFDTSPTYGEAERVLGTCLAEERAEAFVATRLWTSQERAARMQIDTSMACFGDHVNLYQIHNLLAWREQLPRLEAERDAGRVGLIGVTHHNSDAYGELAHVLRSGRIDAVQIPYNPLEHDAEQLLPLAASLGIAVIAMRPMGDGALLRRLPEPADLLPLAPFGITSWPQALLKWVLSDERVHAVIPATASIAHFQENAAAGSPPWLDEEARRWVSDLARSLFA